MDRGQARALILLGSVLLLAADKPTALPISDSRWLAAGAPIDGLLREPGECIAWQSGSLLSRSGKIGQAMFRAPLLLGGQAARAGLSCASCHRNGRGNPDFHFPGISDAPGTADVTASLLSSHRGDGEFNPKPIPDLATSRKISRDPGSGELQRFIRGLIVEEFDGPEPPPAVLRGLVDYVRMMDPKECGAEGPVTLSNALTNVSVAVDLAEEQAARGDAPTARALLGAARSELGRIDERFSLAGLDGERAVLRTAAVELGQLQLGRLTDRRAWIRWRASWPARRERLRKAEDRSLYSETMLRELAGAPAR